MCRSTYSLDRHLRINQSPETSCIYRKLTFTVPNSALVADRRPSTSADVPMTVASACLSDNCAEADVQPTGATIGRTSVVGRTLPVAAASMSADGPTVQSDFAGRCNLFKSTSCTHNPLTLTTRPIVPDGLGSTSYNITSHVPIYVSDTSTAAGLLSLGGVRSPPFSYC